MLKKLSLLICLFLLSVLISGCGADTTIDVQYSSELTPDNIGEGQELTVAQFLDETSETGIAGAKNPIGNITTSYRPTTPIGELVRDTLAEELEKRGFEIDKMGLWDLNPENIEHLTTELAMGGEIKAFWAENRPRPGRYQFGGTGFGEVSLYIVVVNPESGEQIWIGEITGGVTREGFWGTPSLEEMLEDAFSEAIDKLLTSDDFITSIQEVK